jgi:hypothetical protein
MLIATTSPVAITNDGPHVPIKTPPPGLEGAANQVLGEMTLHHPKLLFGTKQGATYPLYFGDRRQDGTRTDPFRPVDVPMGAPIDDAIRAARAAMTTPQERLLLEATDGSWWTAAANTYLGKSWSLPGIPDSATDRYRKESIDSERTVGRDRSIARIEYTSPVADTPLRAVLGMEYMATVTPGAVTARTRYQG